MASPTWREVLPALLTVTCLSPFAVALFMHGVPIEMIVFGLLLAGYKGPQLVRQHGKQLLFANRAAPLSGQATGSPTKPADDSLTQSTNGTSSSLSEGGGGGNNNASNSSGGGSSSSSSGSRATWRAPWRRAAAPSGRDAAAGGGNSAAARPASGLQKSAPAAAVTSNSSVVSEGRNTLSALKQKTPQLQWRGLINKFTPEKFDRLCEQLLETLPTSSEGRQVSEEEFKRVLEDLLSLIFDASSRQHQYTEMYTDLVQKIIAFVAAQQPSLDSKVCIWGRCQEIFKKNVLTPLELPEDMPEDECMDRKAKHKEKMVGIVKFGGDLVSRGLVPCEGVMQWIQTLLSEKTQELFSGEGAECSEGVAENTPQNKDAAQREVQLELLCAVLAGMGSSMNDEQMMGQENRLVIEDVFLQLEQLSRDAARLSLRIRCLIRDVLDLRMAQWKEKEGKLKPGVLEKRSDSDSQAEAGVSEARWFEPQLLATLQGLEHHLEVIEDKDAKLQRLQRLVKMYSVIQEEQVLVVVNSSNLKRVGEFLASNLAEVPFSILENNQPDDVRRSLLQGVEQREVSVVLMASEVSTRKDFELSTNCKVLVNFDFPMTLPLYLYRLHKRAEAQSHVYTFFSPRTDIRHTAGLLAVLEAAGQKAPDTLKKVKEQINSESANSNSSKGREKGGSGSIRRSPPARGDDATTSASGNSTGRGGPGRRPLANSGRGHSGSAANDDAGSRPSEAPWFDDVDLKRTASARGPPTTVLLDNDDLPPRAQSSMGSLAGAQAPPQQLRLRRAQTECSSERGEQPQSLLSRPSHQPSQPRLRVLTQADAMAPPFQPQALRAATSAPNAATATTSAPWGAAAAGTGSSSASVSAASAASASSEAGGSAEIVRSSNGGSSGNNNNTNGSVSVSLRGGAAGSAAVVEAGSRGRGGGGGVASQDRRLHSPVVDSSNSNSSTSRTLGGR